jgi:hypothetical protein
MHPRDVAQEILDQHGNWTVSQVGRAGLVDLIWDAYPAYQRMDAAKQARVRDAVAKEIFG